MVYFSVPLYCLTKTSFLPDFPQSVIYYCFENGSTATRDSTGKCMNKWTTIRENRTKFFTDDQFITEGSSVKVIEFLTIRLWNKPETVIFETAEYQIVVLRVVLFHLESRSKQRKLIGLSILYSFYHFHWSGHNFFYFKFTAVRQTYSFVTLLSGVRLQVQISWRNCRSNRQWCIYCKAQAWVCPDGRQQG